MQEVINSSFFLYVDRNSSPDVLLNDVCSVLYIPTMLNLLDAMRTKERQNSIQQLCCELAKNSMTKNFHISEYH
jgi:hypothetical protein